MSLSAVDFEIIGRTRRNGPRVAVEDRQWGYAIRDDAAATGVIGLLRGCGRFMGVLLFAAAIGLWVLPEAVDQPELFVMKLASMVLFSVVGGHLIWISSGSRPLEAEVDTRRSELRVGRRNLRAEFRTICRLDFTDIASVYLLRSKDRSQPTRLFLRLADSDGAIEVARGPAAPLEALRQRLAGDLARVARPRPPSKARRKARCFRAGPARL